MYKGFYEAEIAKRQAKKVEIEIRKRVLFGLIIAAVLVGVYVSSVVADHLFGTQGGFNKARNGQTLLVYSEVVGLRVADIIAPWNTLVSNAGRRTPLFATTLNRSVADIEFVNSASTWVQAFPCSDYNCDYTLCRIHSSGTDTHTFRHEIGHCLGFADHIYSTMDPVRYINPKICDDPAHPKYSSYKGVMSYCDWNYEATLWFKDPDRQMLIKGGYISKASSSPSPTPTPIGKSQPTPSPSPFRSRN